MAIYRYTARSAAGEEVSGVIDADSETAAVRSLDERKLFPVQVSAVDRGRRISLPRRRLGMRDIGVMYGQLGDLLQAGVPMLRAMETIMRASPDRRMTQLLGQVRDDVAAGRSLAEAMAQHGRAFIPLHVAMIRAGERAGFLEDVLANLAAFIERQDELRSKVRGAMIYPAVLVTIGASVLLFLLVSIVPKFKPMMGNMSLPLPTRVLFAASDLLSGHLLLTLSGLVLVVLGVRALLRGPHGRRLWDRWRLKIPLFGGMMRTVAITRFCRILGTMLNNGVPIIEALTISKDATGSGQIAEGVERAAESVRAGEKLADPLRASGMFPPQILEMIAVAEESNRLEKVLLQVAETVDRRAARQVDAAVRVVEPLILVALAGVIGFIALGLLYPIFTMSRSLK